MIATVFLSTVLFVNIVHAHGIWFAERSQRLALIFGVGADDLNIVERLSKVTDVAAYDVLQQPVETSLHAGEFLVVADTSAHPAIVTAVFDNGIWSQKDDGSWLRGGRNEVPGAISSVAVLKYAVHLSSALGEPLGHLPEQQLQIVPDDAILPDKMETEIGLRILFRGNPVAGAEVIRDFVNDPDARPIPSNGDGRVRLKIRNQGLNVIKAFYETASDDHEAVDNIQMVATLSFVLPHEPE